MRETILGNNIRKVPSVAVGCMRLSEKTKDEMNHFIHAALEQDAYFFDHADIYGGGMSESVFGEAIADDPSIKREDIYLQSKCGIRQANCPEVTYRDDGTVTVYYLDQKLDVTDKFDEDGVCYVQLEGGEKTIYMTIKRGNGYATSTTKYILPNEFNN